MPVTAKKNPDEAVADLTAYQVEMFEYRRSRRKFFQIGSSFFFRGKRSISQRSRVKRAPYEGKAQKKNVRQRKDYHNKRGTCWSRVYVYIRLDDITLPLDLGEYRSYLLGECRFDRNGGI